MDAEYFATIKGIKQFRYKGKGEDLLHDLEGKEEGNYWCNGGMWNITFNMKPEDK